MHLSLEKCVCSLARLVVWSAGILLKGRGELMSFLEGGVLWITP